MTDDLVTQIRQALEERAARIKHRADCGDWVPDMSCTCDRPDRTVADAARAIAAALDIATDRMLYPISAWEALGGTPREAFVAALRQEAP